MGWSYLSAEVQSVYSTAPANWATGIMGNVNIDNTNWKQEEFLLRFDGPLLSLIASEFSRLPFASTYAIVCKILRSLTGSNIDLQLIHYSARFIEPTWNGTISSTAQTFQD